MAGRSRSEAGDLLRISMLTPNGSVTSACDSEEGGPPLVPGGNLAANAPALPHRRKPSMAGTAPCYRLLTQGTQIMKFVSIWSTLSTEP